MGQHACAHHGASSSPQVLAMVPNVKTMSLSITLSTLAILKTWIEVVQQSREAGISVPTKARQLWDVGAGLPLDALKKGSIVDWACTYVLNKAEIPPLIDALGKNTSLSRLNLAKAGFEWDHAGGSASPIVEALNKEPTALAGLHKLVINDVNEFEIPMGEIRGGHSRRSKGSRSLRWGTTKGLGTWTSWLWATCCGKTSTGGWRRIARRRWAMKSCGF